MSKFLCVDDGMTDVNVDLIQKIKIEPYKKSGFYEINIYILGLKEKSQYAIYKNFGDAQIAATELMKIIGGRV